MLRTKNLAFDDLIYLKDFIRDIESRDMMRGHSIKYFNEENAQFTPRGILQFQDRVTKEASSNIPTVLKDGLSGQKSHTSTTSAMDMGEFLVHLNLHMQMNLDYVFLSGIKEILGFFSSLEKFMVITFGNKELEIKIDMMRLVIRMTNAISFVDKLFMLDLMRIEYLDRW